MNSCMRAGTTAGLTGPAAHDAKFCVLAKHSEHVTAENRYKKKNDQIKSCDLLMQIDEHQKAGSRKTTVITVACWWFCSRWTQWVNMGTDGSTLGDQRGKLCICFSKCLKAGQTSSKEIWRFFHMYEMLVI
ncbi:hypothetical protein DNTS_034504 [Danionella cerebrum]|uniref:Uncharacterized protein n=1 Tax=Danionella cerebrum TaxID=2873325 RepID=A0A553MLM8_9TELE|nr:hypothetical protein DNTS_034504 [Danionella translucida]